MSETFNQVLKAALALSFDERMELAARLLESVDPPEDFQLSDEWMAEIERRSAELHSGKVKTYAWEEVRRFASEQANNECGAEDEKQSRHPTEPEGE